MTEIDWYAVSPLTETQQREVWEDLGLIGQGEELDLPWRRLRILLDHKFVKIVHPVFAQGSRTSLDLSDEGLAYIDSVNAARNSGSDLPPKE